MYNLLILGSGRSGTSMAAGLFKTSGYFSGDSPSIPTPANPFGYFEDMDINYVNALIIFRMMFTRSAMTLFPWLVNPIHRDLRATWLASPRFLLSRPLTPELEERIRFYTSRTPFCYKDPRFNVTLPTWRPYLPKDTRFLVVFREPDRTVNSMLHISLKDWEPPIPLTPEWAYLQWSRNYGRLLDRFADDEDWLFVDYNSIAEHRALPAIRAFTEADLDAWELDPSVRRSQVTQEFAGLREAHECYRLYDRLSERSARDIAKWSERAGSPRPSAATTAGA